MADNTTSLEPIPEAEDMEEDAIPSSWASILAGLGHDEQTVEAISGAKDANKVQANSAAETPSRAGSWLQPMGRWLEHFGSGTSEEVLVPPDRIRSSPLILEG